LKCWGEGDHTAFSQYEIEAVATSSFRAISFWVSPASSLISLILRPMYCISLFSYPHARVIEGDVGMPPEV